MGFIEMEEEKEVTHAGDFGFQPRVYLRGLRRMQERVGESEIRGEGSSSDSLKLCV